MAGKKKTTMKKAAKKAKKNAPKKEVKARARANANEEPRGPQRRRSSEDLESPSGSFLDNTARRDIAGICFIVLGIALMVFICMPSNDAFLNGMISTGLHFLLGLGSYIFPLIFAIVGIVYICKPKRMKSHARLWAGMAIIYISLLGVFAMFAPIQSMGHDELGYLFEDDMLIGYGGYLGNGLSWLLMSFFGRIVSGIILAAMMVVGFVFIGFSISRPIQTAKERREASEPLMPERHRTQTSGFARVRMADDRNVGADDVYRQMRAVRRPMGIQGDLTTAFGNAQGEYLELPQPEFLQNLYPEDYAEDALDTGRLSSFDEMGANTRRLVPIRHEDVSYTGNEGLPWEEDDDIDGFPYEGHDSSHYGDMPTSSGGDVDDEIENEPYGDLGRFPDGFAQGDGIEGFSLDQEPPIDEFEYSTPLYETTAYAHKSEYLDADDLDEALPEYEEGFSSYDEFLAEVGDLPRAPTNETHGSYEGVSDLDAISRKEEALGNIDLDEIHLSDGSMLSMNLDVGEESISIPSLEPVEDFGSASKGRGKPKVPSVHLNKLDEPASEDASKIPSAVAPEDARKRSKPAKSAPASKPAKSTRGGGSRFKLPSMSLLRKSPKTKKRSAKELQAVAATLQKTLSDFGVAAEVVDWIAGPTVTLFEVNLPAGVKVSKVSNLGDDIALALASPGIRIFAPVPGTNYVGIEVPNKERETVYLSDVLVNAGDGPLEIAIGKDVEGHSIVSDLSKMPHLLIGGTTGSGKSVAINAMIMSLLMRATPAEVRLILVDPKRVEFTPYNGIPHLYVPVVTEPGEAASALSWGVAEMERRLKVFSAVGARNISQYNAKAKQVNESYQGADDEDAGEMEVMPYIVIVIDELADLMMNVGKEVEISISRIAQLARAAGIHLIVATQRPSTNIVTGLIKANITNRIAFNVASSIDSRVILDSTGAENLIGLGDLLLSKPELAKPQRIQACFVSESEIEKVVDFVKSQGDPEYHNEILNVNTYGIGDTNPKGGSSSSDDPLVWEAADIVVSSGMGSTSNLQRRLKVGYARAGRIMDQLEELGIVGPANGSKPRAVLLDEGELAMIRSQEGLLE